MTGEIRNIIILGGGSAGWLTANYLAASLNNGAVNKRSINKGVDKRTITLIESPDIPIIGVGEGTWPSMRNTLSHIGISEAKFLTICNASFKQGSKFVGWTTGTEQDYYYHPFTVPPGYAELNLYQHWQAQYSQQPYSYAFCAQPTLCDEYKAPKQLATPEYAYVANYGYHFDAGKLTELLTEHGVQNLGIKHIKAHVSDVQNHVNGDVKGLMTAERGLIEGDLFIDCSGLRGRLIQQHYGIDWHNVQNVLKNNAAVAIQVPYSQTNSAIESTTVATAIKHGWTWDIGLYHRRGMGYSYSSDYIDTDQAETELRQFISKSICKSIPQEQVDALNSRHLQFTPGYRKTFWHRNCLAIGMSAGFIEPLEASALAMVELSLTMLTEELPQNGEHMDIVAKRFNQRFEYRWQRVIDFLKLHYVLSQRKDSDYWLQQRNKDSIPEQLQELLTLWRYQSPSRNDFHENEEIFSSPSYQYVLYGMDYKTAINSTSLHAINYQKIEELVKNNHNNQQRFLAGLPSNREYLSSLHEVQNTSGSMK